VDIKGMNLNPPISDFHCKFILQKFTGWSGIVEWNETHLQHCAHDFYAMQTNWTDKHHISRLMNTYTRPSGNVDHMLQPVNRVVKPITKLYGVQGTVACVTNVHCAVIALEVRHYNDLLTVYCPQVCELLTLMMSSKRRKKGGTAELTSTKK
jgi:hypothetical protein